MTQEMQETQEPRCHYCNGVTDETLDERSIFTRELRPYGPCGAWVCFGCAMSTPERKAEAGATFLGMLETAAKGGAPVLLTPVGPVPLYGEDA